MWYNDYIIKKGKKMYKIRFIQTHDDDTVHDAVILSGFVTERSAKIAIQLLYDRGTYDERFHLLYVSK
jgi:hypothetical protein